MMAQETTEKTASTRSTTFETGLERAISPSVALGHSAALRLLEQGEQGASKRAQTALRQIAVRRWDSAAEVCTRLKRRTVSRCKRAVKPMLGLEFPFPHASLPEHSPSGGHRLRSRWSSSRG